MNRYELEPRFDSRTGKPIEAELIPKGWMCDFCGALHTSHSPDVFYEVSQRGTAEPYFDEYKIKGFPDIDLYDLSNDNPFYQYCTDHDQNKFCERDMVLAALSDPNSSEMLCQMMYKSRVEMLSRVLKSGILTPEQLNLKFF